MRAPVLLDLDGVLADFDGPLFERFGHVLDISGPEEQTHRFLTDHITTASTGSKVLRNRWRSAMRDTVEAPGWFLYLPVMDGAKKAVSSMLEEGLDLWVCSKPLEASYTCASHKYAWVAREFPALASKVILTPNKGLVHGAVLIDDAPKETWLSYASWEPWLYEHPWNMDRAEDLYSLTWSSFDLDDLLDEVEDSQR